MLKPHEEGLRLSAIQKAAPETEQRKSTAESSGNTSKKFKAKFVPWTKGGTVMFVGLTK